VLRNLPELQEELATGPFTAVHAPERPSDGRQVA
jgi:hypothetical protein